MSKNNDIRQKVEEIMGSLDNLQPASPQPFFYTRVQARLMGKKRSAWDRVGGTISSPAVAFCSIVLVVLLNALVVFNESSQPAAPQNFEMAVAEEYNSSTTAFYDLENTLP